MATTHYNGLTEAEAERLALLIEECGEVIQAACKVLRHGYDSTNMGARDETNRSGLERELGDAMHCIERMFAAEDLSRDYVHERMQYKGARVKPHLHHQP